MDSSTILGLAGLVAGFGSAAATLYVARRGGSFRQRSAGLSIGGYHLASARELTVVYGVPGERTPVLSSLFFELSNPGNDTIDDIVITVVVPKFLGGFFDEQTNKSNVTFTVTRGIDPGTSSKVERVGIHDHLHMTLKSIHPLSAVGLEIPVGFPGAASKHTFKVPVTFKDGVKVNLDVEAHFNIPIEILLMARKPPAKRWKKIMLLLQNLSL